MTQKPAELQRMLVSTQTSPVWAERGAAPAGCVCDSPVLSVCQKRQAFRQKFTRMWPRSSFLCCRSACCVREYSFGLSPNRLARLQLAFEAVPSGQLLWRLPPCWREAPGGVAAVCMRWSPGGGGGGAGSLPRSVIARASARSLARKGRPQRRDAAPAQGRETQAPGHARAESRRAPRRRSSRLDTTRAPSPRRR